MLLKGVLLKYEKNDERIKSLEDFSGNTKAYADYLESAECADDMDYDIYVDLAGNVYERTNGSWKIGHGHNNVHDPREPRNPDDPKSTGRGWKNPWLIYDDEYSFSDEEIDFILSSEPEKSKVLKKKL